MGEWDAHTGALFWRLRRSDDVELLVRALGDPELRTTAARRLGKVGDARAIPPLLRLLRASDPHARVAAIEALGALGDEAVVPALLEIADHDQESFVRSWALGSLGKVGARSEVREPDLVPFLIQHLDDPDWKVRNGAASGLTSLADARALQPLRAARGRQGLRHRWYLNRPAFRAAIRAAKAASRKERGRAAHPV